MAEIFEERPITKFGIGLIHGQQNSDVFVCFVDDLQVEGLRLDDLDKGAVRLVEVGLDARTFHHHVLSQPFSVMNIFLQDQYVHKIVRLLLHIHHRQIVEDKGDLVLFMLLKWLYSFILLVYGGQQGVNVGVVGDADTA